MPFPSSTTYPSGTLVPSGEPEIEYETRRIEWNKPGQRFFEAGVDQGVLYPRGGPGVPWNGLVAVNEDSSGGDLESLYFDGVKYLDIASGEDFQATIEAYSAPAEFNASDGIKALAPGLFVTQQRRATFGLSYRALIGNDLQGQDYGYKLHIVYNCTASASARSNKTITGDISPNTRSWTINTVPPPATTFRPTAHLVIDSTLVDPYLMENLETVLYGRDETAELPAVTPSLPTVAEVVLILSNQITELIEEFV